MVRTTWWRQLTRGPAPSTACWTQDSSAPAQAARHSEHSRCGNWSLLGGGGGHEVEQGYCRGLQGGGCG